MKSVKTVVFALGVFSAWSASAVVLTADNAEVVVAKGKTNNSYLMMHLLYCSGKVWFDDVRLEEIE